MHSAPAPARAPARAGASVKPHRGFTLLELLIVAALIAVTASLVTLALPDPQLTQLEREAERLAALLEGARAEARASGVWARWEIVRDADASGFRFVGVGIAQELPSRWLDDATTAEIVGARAIRFGPEPLIGGQRVVLTLADHRLAVATDGLAPFTVQPAVVEAPQ